MRARNGSLSLAPYSGRGYLATNKKNEASTDLELPWLPGPPVVWQFTQIVLLSAARSAVLHQAFSVPVVRVSARIHRLQPFTALYVLPKLDLIHP